MIPCFVWASILFFLVIIQKTIADVLLFHFISIDLTMIFVVFAGFNMGVTRGSILTLWAGFLMSTLTGSVAALFMCVYMVIFSLSSLVSTRVLVGTSLFIVCFTTFCAVVECTLLVAINRYYLGTADVEAMLWALLPQIPILGIISPFFFRAFKKIEELVYVRKSQLH